MKMKALSAISAAAIVAFATAADAVTMNAADGQQTLAALESQFADPPDVFGVNCWWWWLNGNTDRDAIRGELAAMKSRRFQGAMVFDAGGHRQGGHLDIPAGPAFGGNEWCDLFVFALWTPRPGADSR